MKKIAILGSTGSIGLSTLEVVRKFPDHFAVEVLTVNTRIDLLEKQIHEFHPKTVVVKDLRLATELEKRLGTNCEVLAGEEGLIQVAASSQYDVFVGAMVGFSGLAPTIEAVKRGKRIALANKETLVVAGEMVLELAKKFGAELLPVDSEHSAIFQCLNGENTSGVDKLILTASGGPFLHKAKNELAAVSVEEALNHPNWKMGNKITIDSASMMNKGLEVIEARWLFGITPNNIEIVIHPQSIIHSMVKFVDGSIKAQLSTPDMKLPIQYALTYPERFASEFVQTDLPLIQTLTFLEPDFNKFECLKLAFEVLQTGGTSPCILNASNEVAVEKFLKGKIKFSAIPEIIEKSLAKFENHLKPDLETIINCDKETRMYAEQLV